MKIVLIKLTGLVQKMKGFRLYFNRRTFRYLLRHPLRALTYSWVLKHAEPSKIANLTGASQEEIKNYLNWLWKQRHLNEVIAKTIDARSGHGLSIADLECIYSVVRALKPKRVLETGVSAGRSTSFILQALHDNSNGELYSIDLPSSGVKSGWAVPSSLKGRWHLVTGSSFNEMPKILDELGEIDIFLHDSDHSYECMSWEFGTVWPYLAVGGLLMADDVDWNNAFQDFCEKVQVSFTYLDKRLAFGLCRKVS